jgi:beta-N-acetylhexosaminidase
MRSMTLRDKAAQLVFVPFYGEAPNTRSQEYQKYLRWVRTLHVGGLVLVNRVRNGAVEHAEPFAMATFLNRMQKASRLPLLVAGDFERGDSMRVASETKFPHAMAFAATRDLALSRKEGAVTARQARALGVPWILAPVVDVNNNPDNPIISIRSYGENPDDVSAHTRAFIEGAHSATHEPVLVTAKHFPGHGDASTDTHMALGVLTADKARLEAVELPPFRAAIAAGVDTVMTAHLAVPALDAPEIPATLSRAILTGLLRDEMGFHGLIVTDAMDMNGISKHWSTGQAAVKALEAGVDILLMPSNPEQAVDAVVRAVQSGTLSRQRIDDSVSRVLAAKVRVGLNRRRFIDADAAMDELDLPEDLALVQEVADRAVTLVKNDGPLVPLKSASACFLVLPESRYGAQGKAFAAEVRKRSPNAQILTLDPAATDSDFDKAAATAKSCDVVVVAAYATVAAYRGSTALAGGYPKFLLSILLASERPVVLAVLGNPYLLRSFPAATASLTTYSTVPASELAAVKALFGEIPIQGHLPVTIPGIAKYGDGIQLAH